MQTDFQTFTVRRTVKAPHDRVFALWTDPKKKEAWFCWDSDGWTHDAYVADLREGGHERVRFSRPEVGSFTYASHIHHLRPASGLIYGYTMAGTSAPISVSLATVTFTETPEGTDVLYTEQVVFLDGGDSLATRVPGCEGVLDRMTMAAEDPAHV